MTRILTLIVLAMAAGAAVTQTLGCGETGSARGSSRAALAVPLAAKQRTHSGRATTRTRQPISSPPSTAAGTTH